MKLEERLLCFIKQQKSDVVLRAELSDFGSRSQLTKSLNALMKRDVLVRIGTGIYARTRQSSITGAIIPAGSLETLATEALKKMVLHRSEGAGTNSGWSAVALGGTRKFDQKQTASLP
jgi:hypothetical protein